MLLMLLMLLMQRAIFPFCAVRVIVPNLVGFIGSTGRVRSKVERDVLHERGRRVSSLPRQRRCAPRRLPIRFFCGGCRCLCRHVSVSCEASARPYCILIAFFWRELTDAAFPVFTA
jgi:hypothetical protein